MAPPYAAAPPLGLALVAAPPAPTLLLLHAPPAPPTALVLHAPGSGGMLAGVIGSGGGSSIIVSGSAAALPSESPDQSVIATSVTLCAAVHGPQKAAERRTRILAASSSSMRLTANESTATPSGVEKAATFEMSMPNSASTDVITPSEPRRSLKTSQSEKLRES
eukprot:jgi/Chrpa1/12643/Chrysochromulina_OHIO_Genome00019142-RA